MSAMIKSPLAIRRRMTLQRTYIFIGPLLPLDNNDGAVTKLNSHDLPKVVRINGEFKCPWSEDTKKGITSVFRMLYEKNLSKEPFLGQINTRSMIKKNNVNITKIAESGSNVTWVITMYI
jgi:hypothetical protein